MPDKEKMKIAAQAVIRDMMNSFMHKILIDDPFLAEEHCKQKPLYAALVPDEIFKGSHFERRFVTPFGKVWENLAVVAAKYGLGYGTTNHMINGYVRQERLRRINEVLNRLEHPENGVRQYPDWDTELAYILEGGGELIPVSVVCDVYAEDRVNNKRYAFELKAPMPNSDQTKVSKEKIFKLYCMEPPQVDGAYYALPYNPYGKREDYDWEFPKRWFNMIEDEVVLIGDDFWDKIGGVGTYELFLSAFNEIGATYKDRIYREYLGIEPPAHLPESEITHTSNGSQQHLL